MYQARHCQQIKLLQIGNPPPTEINSLPNPNTFYPIHREYLYQSLNGTNDELAGITNNIGNLIVGAKKNGSYMYIWIYSFAQKKLYCIRHSVINYTIPIKNYGSYRASEIVWIADQPRRSESPRPIYDNKRNQIISLSSDDKGAILIYDAYTHNLKYQKNIENSYKIDFWNLSQNCDYLVCHMTNGGIYKISVGNGSVTVLSGTTNIPSALNSIPSIAIRNDGLCIGFSTSNTEVVSYVWSGTSLNSYTTISNGTGINNIAVNPYIAPFFITDRVFMIGCIYNNTNLFFAGFMDGNRIYGYSTGNNTLVNYIDYPYSTFYTSIRITSFEREDGSYEIYFPHFFSSVSFTFACRIWISSSNLSGNELGMQSSFPCFQGDVRFSDVTLFDCYFADGFLICLYERVLYVLAQYIDSYTIT